MSHINVFVDGSSYNNGYENCVAGYGIYFPENNSLNEAIQLTCENVSNNVAEIYACIKAIEKINNVFKEELGVIYIYCDSEYTINSITKWGPTWEKKGWVKADKKPIKNLELIKKLYGYYHTQTIKFIHVRSHQKKPENEASMDYYIWYGNEMADKLAKSAFLKM